MNMTSNVSDLLEAAEKRIAHLEEWTANAVPMLEKAEAKLAQAERKRKYWKLSAHISRKEGFRAGIEAAAKVAEDNGEPGNIQSASDDFRGGYAFAGEHITAEIRALSPASPTDTVRQAAQVLLDKMMPMLMPVMVHREYQQGVVDCNEHWLDSLVNLATQK